MNNEMVDVLKSNDIQVLRSALQEVEGRIAVVRSDLVNEANGWVRRSDKDHQAIEEEYDQLREDRETLKRDIRKLALKEGLGSDYVKPNYGGA